MYYTEYEQYLPEYEDERFIPFSLGLGFGGFGRPFFPRRQFFSPPFFGRPWWFGRRPFFGSPWWYGRRPFFGRSWWW